MPTLNTKEEEQILRSQGSCQISSHKWTLDNSNENLYFGLRKALHPARNPTSFTYILMALRQNMPSLFGKEKLILIHISYLYFMSTISCCVSLVGAETVMTKRQSSAAGDSDGRKYVY